MVSQSTSLRDSGVQRIASHYAGNAALIWAGCPSSAEVVYRFLEFDGVGAKIATMAANILARDFKIEFADHFAIDISADRQVRRVFGRLGLCPPEASVEQVIYKARALHPVFPGIMDLPCWEIGRKWCRAQNPDCSACYMNELCPTASAAKPPKRSQLMHEAATLMRERFMTAIPDGIAREHVLDAMSRIGPDPAMWPDRSESRKWDVIDPRSGTRLPPKLVLSFAAEIATGHTLSRRDFSGGPETNDRLAQLGFTIFPKGAAT